MPAQQDAVRSFDVFDTVLIRRVAAASDVHRLVYRRLVGAGTLSAALLDEEEFAAARRAAERATIAGKEETTLKAIWEWLHSRVPVLDASAGMEMELTTERDCLMPDPALLREIREARQHGAHVCFISDMYLPATFLRALLLDHGIAQPGDMVFVSSEYGKTKGSGRLFDVVREHYGLPANRFEHTGDSRHGDYDMPLQKGWRAHLVKRDEFAAEELSAVRVPHLGALEKSVLLGTARAERILAEGQPTAPVNQLVGTFLGPASLLWALWVLKLALDSGAKNIYFMARDAYLPYRCASWILQHTGWPVRAHYVETSRSVLGPASVRHLSPESLGWWLSPPWEGWQSAKVANRLKLLGIDDGHSLVQKAESSAGSDADRATMLMAVCTALEGGPLGQILLQRAEALRQLLASYLEQRDFFANKEALLVDIGWNLSGQRALEAAFPQTPLAGLYLGISDNRYLRPEAGPARAMLGSVPFRDPFHADVAARVCQDTELSEALFGMAPSGPTIGYTEDDGRVQAACAQLPSDVLAFRQLVDRTLGEYLDKHAAVFTWAYQSADQCSTAFRALTDFVMASPTAFVAQALQGVSRGIDPYSSESQMIVMPYSTGQACRSFLPARLGRFPSRVWTQASLRLSSLPARLLISTGTALRAVRARIRSR